MIYRVKDYDTTPANPDMVFPIHDNIAKIIATIMQNDVYAWCDQLV